MRLESIKLAGFKSFVDPTVVAFPGNLTAIVGPNGCGKSNIIDAIRWVMGESSAKQLRGQSLDDVIFNGCNTRKPLGKAAIELNFDNSAGMLGGQYSSYSHITIRREITREGQSIYSLNGTRCRRRDIRDIFLGTGLGPRSYAIIEQGMISRIVEAKPEELRAYIEEAAGISKYKERRRETEHRLEHAQENLNRLNDLREELNKQLKHLQRQAKSAERYKALKQEERLLKAQLQALRYQKLVEQLQWQDNEIVDREQQINQAQTKQQNLLTQITTQRTLLAETRLSYDKYQTQYYELGNEITRLTEQHRSQTEQFQQHQHELANLTKTKFSLEQQYQASASSQAIINKTINALNQECNKVKSALEKSQATAKQAELDLQDWQNQWEKIQATFSQLTQQQQVIQTQNQYHRQQSQNLQQRIERLQQEQNEYKQILVCKPQENLTQALTLARQKQQLCKNEQEQIIQKIHQQRYDLQQLAKEIDHLKSHLQVIQGEFASLMTLQQEALGKRDHTLLNWLKEHNLTEKPRLVQLLQVETGWERAVEVALNQHIQAVCLDGNLDDFLTPLPPTTVSLMTKATPCNQSLTNFRSELALPLLSTKLTAPWPLTHLLAGIYVTETTSEALKYTQQLKGYESIITRDGVCLGNHWIHLTTQQDHKNGLLYREREMAILKNSQQETQQQLDQKQTSYSQAQQQLKSLEELQISQQTQLAELVAHQADLAAQEQIQRDRLMQAKQHSQRILQEFQDTKTQFELTQEKLLNTTQQRDLIQTQLDHIEKQRLDLSENKTRVQNQWQKTLDITKTYETELHQHELRLQNHHYQLKTEMTTAENLKQQLKQLVERLISLQKILNETSEHPLDLLQQNLDTALEAQNQLGTQLKASQTQLESSELQIKQAEQQISPLEAQLNLDRDSLEQQRLQSQELRVRAKTLEEQLHESGHELKTLLQEIPTDIDIPSGEGQLNEINHQLDQLGAVNLAALEEQHAISEREKYLASQVTDLTEAVEILQTAIHKMDKETKNRFKETFDKVNQNFMALFPRLFSGGVASLQLQDPDLLSSGICIMAQPPGKRNSSIHLLSGGEKALTATALVFSFFQLNPAPFCMLDEVDAPLDDTNVLRFCKLVKEMSQELQFIFVSHNKVAIEMAQHLAGVTMHEPGVSRMVAVDLEKAIAIAAA